MFAIAVPSTINLSTPVDDGGDPVPFASITFHTPPDGDVSKCIMDVTTPDGDVHSVVFNTRGGVVSQDFIAYEEPAAEDPEPLYKPEADPKDVPVEHPAAKLGRETQSQVPLYEFGGDPKTAAGLQPA